MTADDLKLFILDIKAALLAATGRPLVEWQIEAGSSYAIENIDTLLANLQSKWLLQKTNHPPNSL